MSPKICLILVFCLLGTSDAQLFGNMFGENGGLSNVFRNMGNLFGLGSTNRQQNSAAATPTEDGGSSSNILSKIGNFFGIGSTNNQQNSSPATPNFLSNLGGENGGLSNILGNIGKLFGMGSTNSKKNSSSAAPGFLSKLLSGVGSGNRQTGDLWSRIATMVGAEKNKWKTVLPSGDTVNETAYLAESWNVLVMMAKSKKLEAFGYDKAVTMIDFENDRFAVRVQLPSSKTTSESANKLERIQEFLNGQTSACFVGNTSLAVADVKSELKRRSAVPSVSIGTPKKFVAENRNKISEAGLSTMGIKISMFCRDAANIIKIIPDSVAVTDPDTIKILGYVDVAQPSTSVPYEIHLESSILKSATPTISSV